MELLRWCPSPNPSMRRVREDRAEVSKGMMFLPDGSSRGDLVLVQRGSGKTHKTVSEKGACPLRSQPQTSDPMVLEEFACMFINTSCAPDISPFTLSLINLLIWLLTTPLVHFFLGKCFTNILRANDDMCPRLDGLSLFRAKRRTSNFFINLIYLLIYFYY